MIRWLIAAALLAIAPSFSPAPAWAADAWTPKTCGTEPAAPKIDLGTVEKYNASAKKVTQYQKDAQAYNTCVSKEAAAKIQAINASATAIQKTIWGNFDRYSAAFKAAAKKPFKT